MENRISIIVPVYNAEKTLERCVNSLTAQTYENVEIILVNDGSKDHSLAICRQFADQDSRIRVIDKPNGGVSSARNAGLDAARGEYIMFCDSDDWVEPDWCECMVTNHVDGDLTVCDIARDDLQESELPKKTDVEIVERKHFLHHPLLMCSPYNKIFSRNAIEAHGLRFSEKLRLGEDFSFVLSYLSEMDGCVRFVYRKLYYYDVSIDGSLSKKAPELSQCDTFYRLITASMERIQATDRQSIATRDFFVIGHFEKVLIELAQRTDLSLGDKMKAAENMEKMESFRACCDGLQWGNPIYQWCIHRRSARLALLFLVVRKLTKGR